MIPRPVYNQAKAAEAARQATSFFRLVKAISSAELLFTCEKCGKTAGTLEASAGCLACKCRMFRVARTGRLPTFDQQLKDPYNRDVEEDGPNMTQVGGDNDPMSSSGFGQNSRSDQSGHDEISLIRHDDIETPANRLPNDHDGLRDDVEPHADDPLQSPAMSADNSPFNPMKNSEPFHVGPFNMHKSLSTAPRNDSVYERIRRKRKEALI